jgi:adenylosuccinate synthase
MKTCDVVIGSNFGDEGKGLVTDYLASKHAQTLVVRFNGGAQAGHTVETPEGLRHVFGHFGAGTLLGHGTYLSKHFIVNPLLFRKEHGQLNTLIGLNRRFPVYISPDAVVTTPFDMLINQAIESKRGDDRHGSCGVGINETIVRHQSYPLFYKDLFDVPKLKNLLGILKNLYVPNRLAELGLEMNGRITSVLTNDFISPAFIEDCAFLKEGSTNYDESIFDKFDHVVFEGAQGLLLDQNNKEYFPNVTRSNTGLTNVLDLVKDYKELTINAYYLSRWYVTRHGAGKLPNEVVNKEDLSRLIEDKTNITNQHQGSLRYGLLDTDELWTRICKDAASEITSLSHGIQTNLRKKLVLTCMDQIGDISFKISVSGREKIISLGAFVEHANPYFYTSGRTRANLWRYLDFEK